MIEITKPTLDTKKPVGNGITAPVYKNGETVLIATKSADMTNSDSTTINSSYDQANLSAKFKNPRVKQDVPSAGQNQYN